MKSRTIAIAGSVAALAFATAPVAAIAKSAPHHKSPTQSQLDRSRDGKGVRHVDTSPDKSGVDNSRDLRDR